MKRLLKRVPGLRMAYKDAYMLWSIARERWWYDHVQMNDRSHLEHEWNFQAPLEQERHARVLAAIARYRGPDHWGDLFEIGCAEGLFTLQLAPYCRRLLACDISRVACARTAERCASFAQVKVEPLDLEHDPLTGPHDIVLAMDVLEFIHGRRRLTNVLEKLAGAVVPGGLLLISICRLPEEMRERWWSVLFPEGADNVITWAERVTGLELLEREIHQGPGVELSGYIDHIIALFRKRADLGAVQQ